MIFFIIGVVAALFALAVLLLAKEYKNVAQGGIGQPQCRKNK